MSTKNHPFRPISPARPADVAAALRARAAKIDDDTTAGYLSVAATTIERLTDDTPRQTTRPTKAPKTRKK